MRVIIRGRLGPALVVGMAVAWLGGGSPGGAHEDHPATAPGAESEHIHAAVPAGYAAVEAPPHIWTDPAVLRRGEAIHATRCAS